MSQTAERFKPSSVEHALLRNVFLFRDLDGKKFESVTELCTWKKFKAGEDIVWVDSNTNKVFFLLSGRVRVHRFSLHGREITFDQIEPGGIFGELSALDGKPRSADVMGVIPGTIATIGAEDFRSLISSNSGMAFALNQHFVQIIRKTSDRVMTLTSMEAHARVFHTILTNCKKGEEEDTLIFENLTHYDVACMSGCTRETVSRSIGTLLKMGMAKKQGRALHIYDKDAIEQLILKYSS